MLALQNAFTEAELTIEFPLYSSLKLQCHEGLPMIISGTCFSSVAAPHALVSATTSLSLSIVLNKLLAACHYDYMESVKQPNALFTQSPGKAVLQ